MKIKFVKWMWEWANGVKAKVYGKPEKDKNGKIIAYWFTLKGE
jgi:hypothetical protein